MGGSLKDLEYLSLLSWVLPELENHVGENDRVVAEFVISLGRKSQNVEFDFKLKGYFRDYLVGTLPTHIHAIFPPKKGIESKKDGVLYRKSSKYPSLSVADNREWKKQLEKELQTEAEEKKQMKERVEEQDKYLHGRMGTGVNSRGCGGQQSDEPELYRVYRGRIFRVMDSGFFVQLQGFRGREGLVHVLEMASRRIANAKQIVKRGQEVYVKVISVSGQKLSLSMRYVDQDTGKDLLPLKERSEDDSSRTNPSSSSGPSTKIGLSGIRIVEEVDHPGSARRPLKRMSSPEKWEIKQLIASGALSVKECHPMVDEEGAEEELEVELNEDEPPFLQGQTRDAVDMSPVKIFKIQRGL